MGEGRWRIVTMFGEVVAEGDDLGEVTLKAAWQKPEVMTVVVPPGEDVQATVDKVVDDLKKGLDDGEA